MKPYYEQGNIKIFHGDCRDILPILPKANLVLTDFPYGNDTAYDVYQDTQDNLVELVSTTMPLILGGGQTAP